ncbi:response regulator transcription factor [Halothermothrix orenii]|uniref:Stage 0 sporulation protein A homolog n=1 Tax=Halothermothrix orenii (strain H 168 / OCM 544 / DSM 9562) TaxID=373903 RepID=B8CXQ9_HALOH|nr:response regulator transcription factor [Halothermothrix orenii]ACL70078.1 two component transcriptional regulator, winged helix family [Halothermothrix orenii H 168]
MNPKILVVDDEKKIRKVLKAFLEKHDFSIEMASDGKEALSKVNEFNPDLIILDLMLPEISGEEVCQKIRQDKQTPILMLTAKGTEEDKVNGFAYGADDYLVKPFSLRELLARIKAILRRSNQKAEKAEIFVYQDGRLKIHPNRMKVLVNGRDADLTRTEFNILVTLIRNPGQVFTREQLAKKVMGLEYKGYDRTIDAHIKNIRKKLNLEKNQLIITVYGVGYKFEGD